MEQPLVNFLVAGTQKGGTSAFASFLARHPQVQMASKKEVHFFDDDENFRAASVDYSLYDSHFPIPASTAVGESTPIYMYWPTAAERIHTYNPRMRLILLLRDPRERAYSQWSMEYARGDETLAFSEAIRAEHARTESLEPGAVHRVYSYLDRGRYAGQIRRLLRHFDREQMLILRSEELATRHYETMNRTCRFLKITPSGLASPERIFVGRYEPMTRGDLAFLTDYFRDDVAELEELLGWNCAAWKQPRLPTGRGAT